MSNRKGIGKSWDWHIIEKTSAKELKHLAAEDAFAENKRHFIDLAKSVWRLEKIIKNSNFPENKKTGAQSALNRIYNFLKLNRVEIKDYTGEKYNEGINADIVDTVKNPSAETDTIKETIEPSIVICGKLESKARIIKEIKTEE
ncbi:MAG: hypothetical protein LBH29_03030 [Elusimicrobiota bacterium]|jgi:hypothetical protein|nr:hypothetical protein [Elusimicrobiota bacterium]